MEYKSLNGNIVKELNITGKYILTRKEVEILEVILGQLEWELILIFHNRKL